MSKTNIKFSVNLINLSPTELEQVISKYEYEGEPSMRLANKRREKPKPEAGLKLPPGQERVGRNSSYKIIKKSYSNQTAKGVIISCQALIKLRAIENRIYTSLEIRQWLTDQKGVSHIEAGSAMLTALRRAGFLELAK